MTEPIWLLLSLQAWVRQLLWHVTCGNRKYSPASDWVQSNVWLCLNSLCVSSGSLPAIRVSGHEPSGKKKKKKRLVWKGSPRLFQIEWCPRVLCFYFTVKKDTLTHISRWWWFINWQFLSGRVRDPSVSKWVWGCSVLNYAALHSGLFPCKNRDVKKINAVKVGVCKKNRSTDITAY